MYSQLNWKILIMKGSCLALLSSLPLTCSFLPSVRMPHSNYGAGKKVVLLQTLRQSDLDGFLAGMFFPTNVFERGFLMPTPTIAELSRRTGLKLRRTSPRYDILESDDDYRIAIDLPGVKASDIEVQMEPVRKIIHLTGKTKEVEAGEVFDSFFEQRFFLGDHVEWNEISANIADGVLVLALPKSDAFETFHVPVTEWEEPAPAEMTDFDRSSNKEKLENLNE